MTTYIVDAAATAVAALRLERKQRGMSQMTLANLSGVSLQAISRMERGVDKPTSVTLFAVARALDCRMWMETPTTTTDPAAPAK